MAPFGKKRQIAVRTRRMGAPGFGYSNPMATPGKPAAAYSNPLGGSYSKPLGAAKPSGSTAKSVVSPDERMKRQRQVSASLRSGGKRLN